MSLFHLAMLRLFLQEVRQVIFKFLMKAQLKKREIMKESCWCMHVRRLSLNQWANTQESPNLRQKLWTLSTRFYQDPVSKAFTLLCLLEKGRSFKQPKKCLKNCLVIHYTVVLDRRQGHLATVVSKRQIRKQILPVRI
jgi:hypothetical protein